ncbi:AzlC family ABC transporter permease [Azospira restricta]|uniref:AzlC family ABC transporter permease n=1 Tax=Azospira restricta TaxID=404405 RepID=A0A974Y379_9RHOO|nr:AzlC family ABC transporter permease [Azospira restricta]QRJ63768.1 AzlC family ABC transporter permease [Azospira restricta]
MHTFYSPSFRAGAREGFRTFLPLSVGLIPWALVTGMSMVGTGFTPLQAMGMNVIVFAGTAQLGTLPLIAAGAPVWLIVATALALNLRFVIFSAAIAQGFRGLGAAPRWLCGHLLTDGVFATCMTRMLETEDRDWRLGYYLAPSLWSWLLWQGFALVGVLAAGSIPKTWSLEFMATIALMILLLPMAKMRPMLVAAAAGGGTAVLLHALPLKLGLFAGIFVGIAAGFAADHWPKKPEAA